MDPVSVILKARNAHLAGIAPTAADKQHADALLIPLVAGFQTGVQAPVVFVQVQMFACRNPRAHLGRSMPNAAIDDFDQGAIDSFKSTVPVQMGTGVGGNGVPIGPGVYDTTLHVPGDRPISDWNNPLLPSATQAISRIGTRPKAMSQKRVSWGD